MSVAVLDAPAGGVHPESVRVHQDELGEGCLKLTLPPSALAAELRFCSYECTRLLCVFLDLVCLFAVAPRSGVHNR